MRAGLRWLVLCAVLVACVALGYGAYALAGLSWDAVVSYRSPYAAIPLPESSGESAEESLTVLVIVDGLTVDASKKMGTLNALRKHGADLELVAPQPSLSYPNWTTLLSGAPPYVSGVVTNWHEGPAPIETLFGAAARAGVRTVFVGPEDFEQLYGVRQKCVATYMKKWDEEYLSAEYVDAAVRIARQEKPQLLVLHLPDVDEAGHARGSASTQYAEVVSRVNTDLNRLVQELQDGKTDFVITADHGHIATGGHGGWEPSATTVPGVFVGPDIRMSKGVGTSEDVAPTVAVLAGIPVPRHALGHPLEQVLGSRAATAVADARSAYESFETAYVREVTAPLGQDPAGATAVAQTSAEEDGLSLEAAGEARLAFDRRQRATTGILALLACLAVLTLVGAVSWPALAAALSGAAAYFVVYNTLFFLVHRYAWSLSAFNSEDRITAWMNGRLIEAAVAGVVGAAVAGFVYPYLREHPRQPVGEYLAGWLTLGPATMLTVLALLGIQIAWFLWAWGIDPTWRLPDLMWAFKYDLDLIQATAVGFVAVVTPVVTYLVGRYHPRLRPSQIEE
ncbi:MAG TPA: alkaline phosphatase family protein [Coriobacteriia bacterium]|nr:alkaline phosphatase family protein [Coriobacteriia bacterium]